MKKQDDAADAFAQREYTRRTMAAQLSRLLAMADDYALDLNLAGLGMIERSIVAMRGDLIDAGGENTAAELMRAYGRR